jgi:single-strand DNA-binding protein
MATKSLNKVMLIGRLGQDPELKYTPSGVPVASFSLATNVSWKDESGNLQERTDWHRIVVWRKLAEICNEYLKKGSKIYIEGRLQTRNYDDKDGKKVYITEVVVNDLIMLDSKGDSAARTTVAVAAPESAVQESVGSDEGTHDADDLPF